MNVKFEGIANIPDYAFYYNPDLASITIGSGAKKIGNYAFYECQALKSATIPSSVTSIGQYAFQYCAALTSITIPSSVASIGDFAFSHCDSLTSVTFAAGSNIAGANFGSSAFPQGASSGDFLKNAYFGTNGGAGTYKYQLTGSGTSYNWIKQP